ncbi:MAG: ATP-binding cassette domain-containing protein [Gammaproteobacteria bacterium]|nr:ATP-binding cassette domain-containing protein [Gammaproteobacteria bacterium]
MLTLSSVTLRRGPEPLLSGLSFTVHPGWRLGVVGRNGCGKSSLFALINGELATDEGDLALPRNLRVATVRQETPSTPQPAIEYVLDGDSELRAQQAEALAAEEADDAGRIAAAHERLAQIDGYAAPARAGALLHGLGFAPEVQARPVASFSGGWRMRLNLARALMCPADLLLLDEPTNHLDLDAVLWLQQALVNHPATLLLVSHDRDFLDAVTDHILHLHAGSGRLYTGNYSSFEQQRAAALAQQAATHGAQQRRIRELTRFVDRFRAKASKARQAQARLKMIERIEQVAPVIGESEFSFEFATPDRLPAPLLRLEDTATGYPGAAPLLQGIRLTLNPGDRVGLLGPNGAGKSTLVKLLAGELAAQGGEVLRDPQLAVGYFAQHQLDQLDPAATPLTHLLRLEPTLSEQAARDYLGGYLFRGQRVFDPVSAFSGGERARLALALLVRRRPNLLLLDEPTNHLDLEMRQALELALHEYAGAVILVSHDRHLMRACCERFLRVAEGGVQPFDGDLDDYARWLRDSSRRGAKAAAVEPAAVGGPVPAAVAPAASATLEVTVESREDARMRRRAEADRRARLKPLRDALTRAERTLERAGEDVRQLEARLADEALYQPGAEAERDQVLTAEHEARARLAAAEQAWLAAAEALEAAVPQGSSEDAAGA